MARTIEPRSIYDARLTDGEVEKRRSLRDSPPRLWWARRARTRDIPRVNCHDKLRMNVARMLSNLAQSRTSVPIPDRSLPARGYSVNLSERPLARHYPAVGLSLYPSLSPSRIPRSVVRERLEYCFPIGNPGIWEAQSRLTQQDRLRKPRFVGFQYQYIAANETGLATYGTSRLFRITLTRGN